MKTHIDSLLTTSQAAERLGLSVHTLRQWVSKRRIKYIKLGRAVRFSPVHLKEYLVAHTRPAEHDGQTGG